MFYCIVLFYEVNFYVFSPSNVKEMAKSLVVQNAEEFGGKKTLTKPQY